jgi:hypothetical protein
MSLARPKRGYGETHLIPSNYWGQLPKGECFLRSMSVIFQGLCGIIPITVE